MARPGIDTRTWTSLARALGESQVDAQHGVFVDVQLLPSGETLTARVPADYAGKSFGFYARIHKDDDLVVALPGGDPANGPVVIARLWSNADTPPQEAIDAPDDIMLVVEKDKKLLIKTSGSGTVTITSAGKVTITSDNQVAVTAKDNISLSTDKDFSATAKGAASVHSDGKAAIDSSQKVTVSAPSVALGQDAATQALVLGTTYRAAQTILDLSLSAVFTALATAVQAAGSSLNTAGADQSFIGVASQAAASCGQAGVALTGATAAVTAAAAAVTAFEAAAATYLSTVVKTV
jgi:hypothetical protein